MSSARKVLSVEELSEIHDAGIGFIADPFNRRWHRASCRRVRAMKLGQPKWFAPDDAAMAVYLETRVREWTTAKPLEPCHMCAHSTSPPDAGAAASSPAAGGVRLEVDAEPHRVLVHSPERVPFSPRAGTPQADVLAQLRSALAGLVIRDGEMLQTSLRGAIPDNSDVENQLLYNIFDAATCRLLAGGVRFEHDPRPAADYIYCYASAPAHGRFTWWQDGDVVASWERATLRSGRRHQLLARTWWSLHEADVQLGAPLPAGARFGARLRLAMPNDGRLAMARAERVKQLVDGVICAFQLHEANPGVTARIAGALSIPEADVATALADRRAAVLGHAERPIRLTAESVHWNPDDTRLVACELLLEESPIQAPLLAGTIFGLTEHTSVTGR